MTDERPEIEELDRTAAWRMRLMDRDPTDTASRNAAKLLENLADDLRREDRQPLWTELQAIANWLGESGTIDDYAALAEQYRRRIGISEHPENGDAYLRALLRIARSVV